VPSDGASTVVVDLSSCFRCFARSRFLSFFFALFDFDIPPSFGFGISFTRASSSLVLALATCALTLSTAALISCTTSSFATSRVATVATAAFPGFVKLTSWKSFVTDALDAIGVAVGACDTTLVDAFVAFVPFVPFVVVCRTDSLAFSGLELKQPMANAN